MSKSGYSILWLMDCIVLGLTVAYCISNDW